MTIILQNLQQLSLFLAVCWEPIIGREIMKSFWTMRFNVIIFMGKSDQVCLHKSFHPHLGIILSWECFIKNLNLNPPELMMEKLWSLLLFIIFKYFHHFLPGFRVIGNISNVLMNLFIISGSIFSPDWCSNKQSDDDISLSLSPVQSDHKLIISTLLDSLNVSFHFLTMSVNVTSQIWASPGC